MGDFQFMTGRWRRVDIGWYWMNGAERYGIWKHMYYECIWKIMKVVFILWFLTDTKASVGQNHRSDARSSSPFVLKLESLLSCVRSLQFHSSRFSMWNVDLDTFLVVDTLHWIMFFGKPPLVTIILGKPIDFHIVFVGFDWFFSRDSWNRDDTWNHWVCFPPKTCDFTENFCFNQF